MGSPLKHQIYEVIRIFMFVGIVFAAYWFALQSGEKRGRARALMISAAWCFGIALVFAAKVGEPSCEEYDSDPRGGACVSYADDGYTPTVEQQDETFVFWSLLLTVPAMAGVFMSRQGARNPWGKPEGEKLSA